ncbi:Band 4.1-like protein 3,Protein 4.1,Erythroid protein 4.1,Protein 4.1 homolog,FERM, ARHGEF and pleckstrin domain-containing protein 1,Band 4.1-like protein 2,Band 4.1-like protein 1,Cytoskeletal protein 4.1 [Mytilus coruscus]|uniref:FERM domain-containing protein n=1 Tax=Mytilus coruscus TaxID=42192 RepID=A0A6J8BQ51_MYTCO|nr:Band 4.1-like protein 3,Protein 4.1,Erythroid protein 4.1,Protein 4.1 homolog,FERM, ARHGEF and pleckstrin domain-containing protein 1,Band 4.1-like protein 2,Band 4.1-like protein 1,Cytoskeletal protein 4.1 [Mytilus coruscus]
MAEEKEKIEEMNSPETEKFLSDNVDDNKAEKNFEKQVINCDHTVMNGPGVSPSQSVDSDSNLKTETSESNSMEFSPDLQNDDMDDDTKLPENDIQTQSVPQEVTANVEEANNITERPSSTLADNNDVNPIQPEEITESIETPLNVEVEQDTEQTVPTENVKTGNGSITMQTKVFIYSISNWTCKELICVGNNYKKVEAKKEVCPKTTKPPSKAKPRSGKMVFCKIHLLDGQLYETDVTKNATGKELFDKVCAYLTLQEKDYFGLQYQNNNVKFWLNNEKKILKQVKGGTSVFDFSVKFYPPEPMAMLEDLSRFQLCLQVRFDIFNGKLPCSFTTLAVVGSYMVQAEVGDYDNIDEYEFGPGDSYLDKIEYAPDKSPEMRSKVYELHKTHKGLTPEEAELQYLENAKKLAMYGVDLHQARDSTGVKLMLGVCASGIQVYKDKLRINRFVWPAILKLSYKRNNFYVKKRPTENEKDGETIGFKLENHKMAKRLWKTCVEHHAFFRLHQSDPPKSSTFPRFNSKFRYSGRTQKQVRDEVEKIENKPKFDRSHFKYSSMPQTNNTEGYNHGYPDEKDRTDQKGVTTPSTESGPPPYFTDSQGPDGYNTLESSADKPNSMGNMSEDRTDRTPGHEDATQEWSPGAGDAATLEAQRRGKKSKEDKEREKREKEEEKRRKKEEEKERKRLEKERKQGKGAEDRTDKLGDETATLGLNGEHYPGSAGLDSGKITAPAPPDGADSRKDLEQQPKAETTIDDSYNNMGTGPGIGIVAPLVSEKQKSVASPETDIDDDAERRKRDADDKLNRDDDPTMNRGDDPKLNRGDGHRKSDKFDDEKKKGDKSKRKESDKSKDKKSGFFGRLRSPKDKDSKKGKGKETDIDSPPGSPTSPDSAYQKETIVKETQISNIVQPAVIEASEKIREVVITEVTKEEMKTEKPEIKVEEKFVETVTNVDTSEKVIEEGDAYCIGRNSNTETEEIKMQEITEEIAAEKETKDVEKIMENKVEGENLAVLSKSEKIKTNETIMKQEETLIEDKTVNKLEEVKKETCNGPNEVIEDEVFNTEIHKTESVDKPVICNHVGSETGSLSSDSSDDEEVCGSYHVESPMEETPPKVKVETILEEEQSESRVEIVNCNETETIPVKLTEVEEKTEIKVKESPVISVEEKLIENEIEIVTTEKKDKVDSMKVTKTEIVSEVKQDIQTEVQKDLNISSKVHDEKQNNQEILVEDKKDNCEKKVDEKRDFDVVVSEQKCVSPDGSQVVSHRSERRTETIQKEVLTHTRRELKPEEFEKYQKEIEAADKKNRMGLQDELGEVRQVIETVVVTDIKNDSGNIVSEEIKEKSKLEEPKEVNAPVESDDKKEESVIEVKVVKSENTLEENVKKMKYIDDSSGDSVSEKVKENDETPEVVKQVVNEEAGNENVAPKLDKKESMRLKKEEKERKKKELAEEKERKKREMQEEKERVKREKLEEKERKKKEKEAEKEKKKKEKDEKKSKKNKKTEAVVEQGIEEISDKNVEKTESEKEKTGEPAEEVVEERVPTAIALVMAKQKEDEKMEEINLKDEPAEVETPKPEEPVVETNKKQKKSKKEKKEKQKEKVEEKPPEEVIEEIVQEEVKPVEEVKVSPKQKGKGLGWALPGMEELQQKGTKHEDSTKRHSTTSSHSTQSTHDDNAKAPIAELTEIQDHNMLNLEPISMNEERTTESASEDVPESCATQVEEVTDLVEKTENVMTEAAFTTPEVGLGVDGDMINRVLPEGEGSIDRRMQFMPVTPPVQETKDSLKGTSNSTMPFFDSASGDTLGKKVPPPVPPKGMRNGFSEEDRLMQDMPPTIPTESFTYENNTDDIPISTKNVPFVKTKTQTVTYEKDGNPYETEDGILISSQSHSTRTQTIETTTYKTEKDGKVETRVEKKVVITDEGDDDDLDHDDLLAEAIRSVTEMNPDLSKHHHRVQVLNGVLQKRQMII